MFMAGNTKQITNAAGTEILPSISPDGKLVAYTAANGSSYSVYVRQLAGGRPILLADSGAAATWKPDGSEILYTDLEAHNFTVPALGGVPTPVPALDGLGGCMYSHGGDRVACTDVQSGAIVIAEADGAKRHAVPGTASSDGATLPAWSPDDKLIAFSIGNSTFFIGAAIGNIAPSSIWISRSDGTALKRISDNTHLNVSPVWTPDGGVLFVSSLGGTRDIYFQHINGDLSPRGDPVRLTTGINVHTISIDRAGKTLAYSVFNTIANVWSAPISGDAENPRLRQVTTGNQTIESATVSSDGRWIAFDSNINGNQDIFKMPLSGGEPQQLTHNGRDNFSASWSPDGKQLAFHSVVNGNRDVFVMDAAGGNVKPVATTPAQEASPVWRPDGKGLVYLVYPDTILEVVRDPAMPNGWGRPRLLGRSNASGAFSPDGKQVVVSASEGEMCTGCAEGEYVLSADWAHHELLRLPQLDRFVVSGGPAVFSPDGRHVYVWIREKGGASSIWQLPLNGDAEKRVFRLTDPSKQFYRPSLATDGADLYFTLGDRQSDIWTMELKKQ
jgi:Tol biopolymer transport system component